MKKIKYIIPILTVAVAFGGCIDYQPTKTVQTTVSTEATQATTPSETKETKEFTFTEPTEYEGGELQHLRDIAFDENAKSFQSARVNYMFPSNEDGTRKMGDVFAYYVASEIEGGTPRAFTENFVKEKIPDLEPYLKDAEEIEEDGSFALGIQIPDASLVLWPDSDRAGITVIYSSTANGN